MLISRTPGETISAEEELEALKPGPDPFPVGLSLYCPTNACGYVTPSSRHPMPHEEIVSYSDSDAVRLRPCSSLQWLQTESDAPPSPPIFVPRAAASDPVARRARSPRAIAFHSNRSPRHGLPARPACPALSQRILHRRPRFQNGRRLACLLG